MVSVLKAFFGFPGQCVFLLQELTTDHLEKELSTLNKLHCKLSKRQKNVNNN